MSGFVPLRSKVCSAIALRQIGQGRWAVSAGDGGGSAS